MVTRFPGVVIGTPGGSLRDAMWAANRAASEYGHKGEQRTAEVIDPIARALGGFTVLHDLTLPVGGIIANIDHIVVSGSKVILIDSKLWRTGKYKTSRGVSRIDGQPADHVSKKTMEIALAAVEAYLVKQGIHAQFKTPIVVVWPSSKNGTLDVRKLRIPGAQVMHGETFAKKAARILDVQTADPNIVQALVPLLKGGNRLRPRPTNNKPVSDDDWSM